MSRWTDEELRELITLWPTHSVLQIAKRLRRPRPAIRGKARLLRLDALRPHNPPAHFERRPTASARDLHETAVAEEVTGFSAV